MKKRAEWQQGEKQENNGAPISASEKPMLLPTVLGCCSWMIWGRRRQSRIPQPSRHPDVCKECEWKRLVSNPLSVIMGILQGLFGEIFLVHNIQGCCIGKNKLQSIASRICQISHITFLRDIQTAYCVHPQKLWPQHSASTQYLTQCLNTAHPKTLWPQHTLSKVSDPTSSCRFS